MYRLNDIAQACHYMQYYFTPYDTGNLARSVQSVGVIGNAVGYKAFDSSQAAPYGAILNDSPTIKTKRRDAETGETKVIIHVNKHYQWLDNFAEAFAVEIPFRYPGITRVR